MCGDGVTDVRLISKLVLGDKTLFGYCFCNANHCKTILNILFMAPRMVYCMIFNLLWSINLSMSTTNLCPKVS